MEVEQTLMSRFHKSISFDSRKRSRSEESFPQFDSFRDNLNQSPLCALARKNQTQKRQKTNAFCYVKTMGGRILKVELEEKDHAGGDLFAAAQTLPIREVATQIAELLGLDADAIRLLHNKKLLRLTDEIDVPNGGWFACIIGLLQLFALKLRTALVSSLCFIGY